MYIADTAIIQTSVTSIFERGNLRHMITQSVEYRNSTSKHFFFCFFAATLMRTYDNISWNHGTPFRAGLVGGNHSSSVVHSALAEIKTSMC